MAARTGPECASCSPGERCAAVAFGVRRRGGYELRSTTRPLSMTTPVTPTESRGRKTARSPREPCLWRAVVSIRSWRDVILTVDPPADAVATSENAGQAGASWPKLSAHRSWALRSAGQEPLVISIRSRSIGIQLLPAGRVPAVANARRSSAARTYSASSCRVWERSAGPSADLKRSCTLGPHPGARAAADQWVAEELAQARRLSVRVIPTSTEHSEPGAGAGRVPGVAHEIGYLPICLILSQNCLNCQSGISSFIMSHSAWRVSAGGEYFRPIEQRHSVHASSCSERAAPARRMIASRARDTLGAACHHLGQHARPSTVTRTPCG